MATENELEPELAEDPELLDALDDDEDLDPDAGDELDRLDPPPETLTLSSGIEVRLLRVQTRQMFRLLRIITHGAGPNLVNISLDFNDDPAEFGQKLLTLILFSIPDAEQETIDFLQSVCEPAAKSSKRPRDMTKAEQDADLALWTDLNELLYNPPPGDTIDIIEAVARREAADLRALGKRLAAFLQLAQKAGQLRQAASNGIPVAPASPGSSPERLISSPVSTDGPTRKSSGSRSAGSGRSPRQSGNGSGKRNAGAAR